jgi:hypothetical protein
MDVEFGNAGELDTHGTGWFVGFGDWLHAAGAGTLRHVPRDSRQHGLCVKWMQHPAGDDRGMDKPISEGRTLSILVSDGGRFRLQFSAHEGFASDRTVERVLQRHGDFALWGPGLHHRYFVGADSVILTLRWTPDEAQAAPSVLAGR